MSASIVHPNTKEDRVILDSLDFEPPCDIKTNQQPCEDVAAWVMVLRAHCPAGVESVTRLVCQDHYQYVVDGGRGFCSDCRTSGLTLRDFVIRLEPIKP